MARLDSIDPTTTDAADLTRVVESNVADIIALQSATPITSNHAAQCEELVKPRQEGRSFIGEISRDCTRCRGFGAIALSKEKQALWKSKLAELRLDLAKVPAGKEGDDARKKAAAALHGGIADYKAACRCPQCDGFGRTDAPGITRQRIECDACRGSGRDQSDGSRRCLKCLGSGSASLGIPDSCWNTVACWRCRGGGQLFDGRRVATVCPVCDGKRYTVPITVRETGCSKRGGGLASSSEHQGSSAGMVSVPDGFAVTWDDGDELSGHARAVGYLEELRDRKRLSAAVLVAYYGADGDRFAKTTPWGRQHAVWPFTEGGKALLQIAAESREWAASDPLNVLAAMRAAEVESAIKHIPWQAHMRAAITESRQLVQQAREDLAEVAGL